jgi:hypothetical protein
MGIINEKQTLKAIVAHPATEISHGSHVTFTAVRS